LRSGEPSAQRMTIKTRLKFIKDRVKFCLTKPRFFKTYKTKKRLLAIFLLVVNAYIYTGVYYNISEEIAMVLEPRVIIIIREAEAGEADSAVDSSENPPAVPDGSLVPAGETLEETGESHELGQVSTEDIAELVREYFPEEPNTAVATFYGESHLDPTLGSYVDRTRDGHAFSWGIAQINLTVHELEGVDCKKAFRGQNNNATVIDRPLFDKCVKLAQDPGINLKKAREIYEGREALGIDGFTAWGVYNTQKYVAYFSHPKTKYLFQ